LDVKRHKLIVCDPSPASTNALLLHQCSEGYRSMALCSALPQTRATCTAAATQAHSRLS
jgi:hypothetical protein